MKEIFTAGAKLNAIEVGFTDVPEEDQMMLPTLTRISLLQKPGPAKFKLSKNDQKGQAKKLTVLPLAIYETESRNKDHTENTAGQVNKTLTRLLLVLPFRRTGVEASQT